MIGVLYLSWCRKMHQEKEFATFCLRFCSFLQHLSCNETPTMKIIIEIDTETDLKPQELELLRANALLANRTEAEQLKIILLGEPQPTQADAA